MKLYKVLAEGQMSPFQYFTFEIGKEYSCEDFDENATHYCSKGFYAVDIDGLPLSFNIHREVWRVEVSGRRVEIDQFKRRYERIKLLELVTHEELRQLAKEKEAEVGYKLSEVLFPVNPLLIDRSTSVSRKETFLLGCWSSIYDRVSASICEFARATVYESVWNAVWASVGDSVGGPVYNTVYRTIGAPIYDSVGAAIWAYIGSLFPNIKEWRHSIHYQPAVDLWRAGLVPSFDGTLWRLHAGEKAEVIWSSPA